MMIETILEPLNFSYMWRAIIVSSLIGGTCAFFSVYLILKGWSLIGDALAHSVMPGVAIAYALAIPYAFGAFFTGFLAVLSMNFIKEKTKLKEDTIIGLIFSSFFAFGLVLISLNPTSINLQGIIFGDILAIPNSDLIQIIIVSVISFLILLVKWRDFLFFFFDKNTAHGSGLSIKFLRFLFFTILSAMTATALHGVGVCLVIAMLITPGATAYLLTDKFSRLIVIAVLLGIITNIIGTYLSYFLDASTGGIIVSLQTFIFALTFAFAPKYGFFYRKRKKLFGN